MIMSTEKQVATTTVISGKKVRFATPSEAKAAMERIKIQYTQTSDNLKKR